jgi:hypothetical protein
MNGSPVTIDQRIMPSDLLDKRIVVLRAGKTKHGVLAVE